MGPAVPAPLVEKTVLSVLSSRDTLVPNQLTLRCEGSFGLSVDPELQGAGSHVCPCARTALSGLPVCRGQFRRWEVLVRPLCFALLGPLQIQVNFRVRLPTAAKRNSCLGSWRKLHWACRSLWGSFVTSVALSLPVQEHRMSSLYFGLLQCLPLYFFLGHFNYILVSFVVSSKSQLLVLWVFSVSLVSLVNFMAACACFGLSLQFLESVFVRCRDQGAPSSVQTFS